MQKKYFAMKNISQSTIFFAICLFFISACVKNNNSTKVNSVITLSKSGIERGEQVFATTNAQNSNSIIKWTVNPSADVQILPANSHATAIFGFAGTYQITASYYSPSDTLVALGSSNAIINVANSIFSPSLSDSSTDTVSIENDQIIISPISLSDSGFIISAQTSNLYNCSALLPLKHLGGAALLWGFISIQEKLLKANLIVTA